MLREKLDRKELIWSQGVTDVLQAKIVEKAGFDALGVQSFQSSMARGVPDTGVIPVSDQLELVRRISGAVNLPIIVDFEQGQGDPSNTIFWMHEFERAGAAALHIDDYGHLYKCPFVPPYIPELEPADETAGRIKAMADNKSDPDFVIMARTGANFISKYPGEQGKEEAVKRFKLYKEAGADVLLLNASSRAELEYFRRNLEGPLMIQTIGPWVGGVLDFRDTPLDVDELYKLGYQIVNEPLNVCAIIMKTLYDTLVQERKARTSKVLVNKMASQEEVSSWMGIPIAAKQRADYAHYG